MIYEPRRDLGNEWTAPIIDETGTIRTFDDPEECRRFALRNTAAGERVKVLSLNHVLRVVFAKVGIVGALAMTPVCTCQSRPTPERRHVVG